MKPRASVFRATYLTIMNEDRVAAIPNWRVGDTTFLPKHMVPAPCQKEKMEIEDCMSEASISYTQTRKKVGDIPIANSHIAVHPICQAWEMLNESTAWVLSDWLITLMLLDWNSCKIIKHILFYLT